VSKSLELFSERKYLTSRVALKKIDYAAAVKQLQLAFYFLAILSSYFNGTKASV